jgi:hypothetical protein
MPRGRGLNEVKNYRTQRCVGDVPLSAQLGGILPGPVQLPGRLPREQQDALRPGGLAGGRPAAVQAAPGDALPLCGHLGQVRLSKE